MVKRIRKEGELMPPFYFGLAYRQWMDYSEVYYWMPICYFIQAYKWLRNKWYKVQHKESPNDKIIKKIRKEAIVQANKIYVNQCKETERYRSAYMACLSAIIGSNISRDVIDRLHRY